MKPAFRSDWKTQPISDAHSTIRVSRLLTTAEIERLRLGVVPRGEADKWFVFWEDNALHFHRSRTGACNYIVRFAGGPTGWRIVDAVVNRDPHQFTVCSDGTDSQLILMLIDGLLTPGSTKEPSGVLDV